MANPVNTLIFSVGNGAFDSYIGPSEHPNNWQNAGLGNETLNFVGTTTMTQQGTGANNMITGGYNVPNQQFSLSDSEDPSYDGTYNFQHLNVGQNDGSTYNYAVYGTSLSGVTVQDSDGNSRYVSMVDMKTALDSAGWVNPENGQSFNGGAASSSVFLAYGTNSSGQRVAALVDYDQAGRTHNTIEAILAYLSLTDSTLVSLDTYSTSGLSVGAFRENNVADVICFARGTMITTSEGERPIEKLKAGDLVVTENGFAPIRWISSTIVTESQLVDSPKLRPIRITAGSLGYGLPKNDLLVSPQHRMLVSSAITRRMFEKEGVLISAKKLSKLPGIFVDESVKSVEYFHILCDKHEVIIADGAMSETLYLGEQSWKTLSDQAREEIETLFPNLRDEKGINYKSDYVILDVAREKKVVERHAKNMKSVLG